jgi:hypothetical protein
MAFYIRLWEFGPRDLDEGGAIQDKYITSWDLSETFQGYFGKLYALSFVATGVAYVVVIFFVVSVLVYYLLPRNWGCREVFIFLKYPGPFRVMSHFAHCHEN